MMRPIAFALLVAVTVFACAPADPLGGIKRDYPGAAEYLAWKSYVLVRFPTDRDGVTRAALLHKDAGEWTELGQDDEGFLSARKVVGLIPEIDESGVRKFRLVTQ
jgi:hypothetical protein